jgi:hypothetical protein
VECAPEHCRVSNEELTRRMRVWLEVKMNVTALCYTDSVLCCTIPCNTSRTMQCHVARNRRVFFLRKRPSRKPIGNQKRDLRSRMLTRRPHIKPVHPVVPDSPPHHSHILLVRIPCSPITRVGADISLILKSSSLS